jgi:hypothetical protein
LNLVGSVFLQVGRLVARKNAELQHTEANPHPVASMAEHMAEFDQMWAGMERKWKTKLCPTKREKFDSLSIENDRDAFRILNNWSQTDSHDFKVHCQSLANRLGVTLKTAANIRVRFCQHNILHQTARYVPHKLAARYQWAAPDGPRPKQAVMLSTWNGGDPGDQALNVGHR